MLSFKNQRIFSLCLEEADKSSLFYQHGCIATCGGKILARAYNTDRTRYGDKNANRWKTCSCHAEVGVLLKMKSQLVKKCKEHKLNKIFKKTTLYISRVKNEMEYNSAPCQECLNMIRYYNIKRIIFYLELKYYIMRPHDYHTTHQSYGKIFIDRNSD
jgi:tRNA(Arg) A34 adenosine deaminase TadA